MIQHDLSRRLAISLTGPSDAIAVEFGDAVYDWGMLAAAGHSLNAALDAAGVEHAQAVGLALRNRPLGYAALVSLLAAGRSVALISPFQATGAIASDIERLGLAAIVADAGDWSEETIAAARSRGSAGIALDETGWTIAAIGTSAIVRPANDHRTMADVAVQMLTSGTTGAPKRIPLHWHSLGQAITDQGRMAAAMGEAPPGPAPEAALIQYAPMVQLSGLYNALQAATEGRRLILMEKFSPERWINCVRSHRQHMLALPPAMMRMVMEADPAREDLASLRAVRSGAAPLDDHTRDSFEARYGVPVLSIYGATEFAGPVASWSLDDHARFSATKRGSVGRIWADIASGRIIDPDSKAQLPPDASGILHIQVGRVGEDWIPTNDLATIDADGFLFIHGRADDAINRGGFKIPPDIIADMLRRHPRVYDAAALPLPDARLGQVPAAAVELRDGMEPVDEALLTEFLRQRLLAYQVPVRILILPTLPRTPAQKISRPELLALFQV